MHVALPRARGDRPGVRLRSRPRPAPGRPARTLTLVAALEEFDGSCQPSACAVGTFAIALPAGETIASAALAGTFGNSSATSSAPVQVFLDGALVATCRDVDPCFDSQVPVAWSFDLAPADFALLADGSAALSALRTGGQVVRLGETTLTVTTVPEPSSALLLGLGLTALALAHRPASRGAPRKRAKRSGARAQRAAGERSYRKRRAGHHGKKPGMSFDTFMAKDAGRFSRKLVTPS